MAVLAFGSAHDRPSAQPPLTLAEIFRHTYLQSHLQTSPPTPRSHIRSFGTEQQLLKIPPFSLRIYDSAVGRGGPRIFLLVWILLFLFVWSPWKISEPYNNFWIYPPKYVIVRAVGGFPDFFFDWNPNIMFLRSPCKNLNPTTTATGIWQDHSISLEDSHVYDTV
jgi:hypothetical protein